MKPAAEYVSARIDAPEGTPELEELLSDIYLVTGILADCIGVSKRDQSLDHRLKLLGLREKAHKAIPPAEITVDDEIRLGNARTDLACAHMQRAEYTKAGEIIEEMLPHYRRWGSEADYPYEYSKYYEYSAFVLMADGDPDKAIVHARKGADLEERHAGQVDSTVLIAHYSIASLLFNAGKVQESLKLHEEVLKERRRLCGEGSQYTLESLETTGVLLHLTQNNVRAKEHLERCLVSRHRDNWTVEGIARARFWLSKVLHAIGDHDKAKQEESAARKVRDQFLKDYPEHLQEDPNDEMVVFDQMLPMWVMQTTGKLQEGGRMPR